MPTAFAVFWAFAGVAWDLIAGWQTTIWFLIGAVFYLFVHRYIYSFSRLYVFAHEAAHALAAMFCGHKVDSMTVGQESGNVKLSGVNTVILLAPYGVPLLAFMTVFTYFILNLFIANLDKRIFILFFGFFTAHHLIHTYKALTEAQQSDVKLAGGNVFSFSFIVLLNAVIIMLLLELIFPGVVPVWGILKKVIADTASFWIWAFRSLYRFIMWAGGA